MASTPKKHVVWAILDEISCEVWDGEFWTFDENMMELYDTENKVIKAFNSGPNRKLGAIITEFRLD